MHKDYDYLHGREVSILIPTIDGEEKILCYVAGIDRDIGITLKSRYTGIAMYCITRPKKEPDFYNDMYDGICEQIESGTIDVSKTSVPSIHSKKSRLPLICPFTEGDV
jgi:hypothetical protein